MPMRRPWMRSYTWPTQMGPAACRCAEAALTRDRAFGRSGTLLLAEKGVWKKKMGAAVWPSGKVQLQVSKASLTAAETVESIFLKHFTGRWISTADWEATIASNSATFSKDVDAWIGMHCAS